MSAFPNKYVPVEHSMVGLAAYLIAALNYNDTVSSLWDRVRHDDRVRTFDRFARALTILFAGGLVRLDQGVLRREAASETDS
jgi:hypothetical protein